VKERKNVNRQQQLRELLRAHPDGISEESLLALLRQSIQDYPRKVLRNTLHGMDDAYIPRWVHSPVRLRYVAVWVAVPVPENAPQPTKPRPSQADYRKVIQE
jgi:hypothetical protein